MKLGSPWVTTTHSAMFKLMAALSEGGLWWIPVIVASPQTSDCGLSTQVPEWQLWHCSKSLSYDHNSWHSVLASHKWSKWGCQQGVTGHSNSHQFSACSPFICLWHSHPSCIPQPRVLCFPKWELDEQIKKNKWKLFIRIKVHTALTKHENP